MPYDAFHEPFAVPDLLWWWYDHTGRVWQAAELQRRTNHHFSDLSFSTLVTG